MATNINLRITANTTLGSTLAQLKTMEAGMAGLQTRADQFANNLQRTGQFSHNAWRTMKDDMQKVRHHYREVIDASGQYYGTTKNITSQTTKFNEALGRQKMSLRQMAGSMRIARDAMKEQMALNQMMVKSWSRDATGRMSVDMWVPKNVDLSGFKHARQQLMYYNEMLHIGSKELINWGKNIQWAGRQLTVGFSVPISIAAGFMARFALEADESLVRIAKVYGDTTSAFQASNDSIRRMAQETAMYVADQYGIAAEETRTVMAELAATGLEGSELQKMTVSTQRLSLLGEMAPDESLKMMRVLKEVYGYSSQELDKQVDYFNAIENATALTMQDITEGIPRIAGMMEATGTSLQEQTELLVAFKAAGIDVAEGANALKSINFKAIAASPTARNSFLRITGQDMTELIEKHNAEFLPMMNEIADIIQTLDQPAKMDLISRVFGIHQGNRAITLLNQLTTGSVAMARAQEVGMMDATELAATANEEIGTIQESLSTRFKRIVETIKVNMASVGEPILEILLPVGEAVSGILKNFNELGEGTKKLVVVGALLLATFGPLVMLTGLMGNLVGMFFSMIASVVSLTGRFQILNPETHAANLIQRAMQKTLPLTTQAMIAQTGAINNMTAAISAHNVAAAKAAGINITTSSSGVAAGAAAGAAGAASPRQQARDVSKLRNQWVKVGGAISGAAGAMLILGSVTGNETLTNVSSVALALGTLGPIAGSMSTRVAKGFQKMGIGAGKAGGAVKGLVGGLGKAGAGLATLLTGPVGLAIAATAAVAVAAWAKHRKQIADLKSDYENLGNSADALGKIYGFMPTTPLQRDLESGDTAASETSVAQNARVKLWKEDEKYGETIIRQRERILELTGEQAQNDAAMAEAAAQARQVMFSGGTEEQARLAAWDWYSMLSNEWTTFEGFTAEFDLKWSGSIVDDPESMSAFNDAAKNLQKAMDDARATAADRRGSHKMRMFTHEDEADLRRNYEETLQAAMSIESTRGQFEALNSVFGDEIRTLQEIFAKGIEEGWIDQETSMEEFMRDLKKTTDEGMKGALGPNPFGTNEARQSLQIVADTLLDYDKNLANLIATEKDVIGIWAGRRRAAADYIDQLQMSNMLMQQANYIARGRQDLADKMQVQIDDEWERGKALLAIEEERWALEERRQQMKDNPFEGAPIAGLEGIHGLMDVARNAKTTLEEAGYNTGQYIEEGAEGAADEITDAQQRLMDSYRDAQAQATNDLADYYEKQFDRSQDAERKALQEEHEGYIQDIEDLYDGKAKIQEADHKRRAKILEDDHKAQQKALDKERKNAEEALEDANDAAMDAIDARSEALTAAHKLSQKALREVHEGQDKALSEQYKELDKQQKRMQEARREEIERTFDLQVEKIEAQIAEEERLEEIRQRMYENEKERISRLQQMFSSNIDLNMAVNSGDLDEAARIASDMSATQGGWATDDLSQISSDASEGRRDKLDSEIELINERRDARLEALDEIEQAEQESLDRQEEAAREALERRQEMEEEALEARYERKQKEIEAEKEKLAELHELNRQALAEDYTLRSERLAERQQQAKDNQSEIFANEKQTLQDARDTAKAIQQEANENSRVLQEERLDDAKNSFQRELENWRGMLSNRKADFETLNKNMHTSLQENHLPDIERANAASVNKIWDDAKTTQDQRLAVLENDAAFSEFAKEVTLSMVNAIYGGDMSISEFRKFVTEGILPVDAPTAGRNDVNRMGNVFRHSGGIIGDGPAYAKYNSRSGPGFGRAKEVPMIGLEGEGVLNLNAMSKPGMPQIVDALNAGVKINGLNPSRPPHMNRKGDGPGIMPGMGASMAAFMRRTAEQVALAGLEVGYANMIARSGLSGTSIDYDGSAGALSSEQLSNAGFIISAGRRMGATQRDIITALMTAMQESSLINVNYGDDIHGVRNADGTLTSSLGLFQQQKWWGSAEDRMNPSKSAELFYRALFDVNDRESMPMWAAAQAVQRSAFPRAYARWEGLAKALVDGASGSATVSKAADVEPGMTWPAIWNLVKAKAPEANMTSNYREGAKTRGYGNLSYHARGQAVDIVSPDMMRTYNKLIGLLPWNEAIYTPAGGRQMRNGQFYRETNPITMMDHIDHIHLAYDGSLANVRALSVDPSNSIEKRSDELRKAFEEWRESGLGFKNGGLIPGIGNTDSVNINAMPGEFMMNKAVTRRQVDLFKAVNNGEIDLVSTANAISRSVAGASRSVDNDGSVRYDINIEFSGPVNSNVDVEKVVHRVIRNTERKKTPSRRISG